MVPKLMLDGMPYSLSDITASLLSGDTTWNGIDSAVTMESKLMKLDRENKGPADNGYWISFVEIMDSNGDWFVPKIQYAFHVFQKPQMRSNPKIYDMFTLKNIYVRNTQGDTKWRLVEVTQSIPIPEEDQVTQGFGAISSFHVSEDSHIWGAVVDIEPSKYGYVALDWLDISSFAYRELLLRSIDPNEGELKMLIQVADEMNKFQASINKEVI